MRCFEDDLERHRIHFRRGSQHTVIMIINNSIPRGEAIDGGVDIARQNFSGLAQRWPQQVFSQGMAPHKTVDTLARIVGVELDDSAEMAGAQFVFVNFYLRLNGRAPKLPVQITAPTRTARVVLEPSRVAQRIDLQQKVLS